MKSAADRREVRSMGQGSTPSPTGLALTLLGDFSASIAGGAPIPIAAKKSRALLAILALSPGGAAPRERLAGLLWSDRGDEQARSSLRQTLAALRREFAGVDPRVLATDGDRIALDPGLVSVDAVELQRLSRSADPDSLRRAAALYRGELLADAGLRDPAFEEWLADARRRLRDEAIVVLERLVRHESGAERVAVARRLIALDPLREASHRMLMEAHAAAGETALALQHYAELKALLQAELGVPPEPETEALRQRLSSHQVPTAEPPAPPAPASASPRRITIAVLPFTNLSGDAAQDYFVEGLTEDLITALAKSRHLHVLSRHATAAYTGGLASSPEAGRQLGAHYLVEGSVRIAGKRVRVTMQLVDVGTGGTVLAERYDREMADIFALQDEVVASIAGTLSFDLIDVGVASRKNAPTENLTAYDHLLRGRSAWRRGEAFETRDHFLKAVEADPNYAAALASLAFFASYDIYTRLTSDPPDALAKLSRQYVERAIAANDGDSYAHHMIGTTLLCLADLERAKLHMERAIALNPHYPSSWMNLGNVLSCMGRHREGLDLIDKGMRLEPRLPPAMRVDLEVYCALGDCQAAAEALSRVERPFAFQCLIAAACCAQAGSDKAQTHLASFEALRTPWFDMRDFALRWVALYWLPEDKARLLDGFRKLGIEV